MGININCIYIEYVTGCKNENIKRSLFGFGARLCVNYPYRNSCKYQKKFEKIDPKYLPGPPPPIKYSNTIKIQFDGETKTLLKRY